MKHTFFPHVLMFALVLAYAMPAKASPSDDYLKGYINALLKYDLHHENVRVEVTKGIVTLIGLTDEHSQRLAETKLLTVEGVADIQFDDTNKTAQIATKTEVPTFKQTVSGSQASQANNDLWTKRLLFVPAIADTRSPRFSAAWHGYLGNSRLDNVGSVSFGETLTLISFGEALSSIDWLPDSNSPARNIRDHHAFDLNFQGAVFSIFDFGGASNDLVNSDFWAALALSWRHKTNSGDISAMSRIYHQSSHLGDEFILFNKITEQDRVNLSYEGVDLTVAWQPNKGHGLKFYGGGGYLLRSEPSSLHALSLKIGMEIEWPDKILGHYPVAAAHFQTFEETGFEADVSLVAGIQLNNPVTDDRQVRLLLNYFNGHSPDGQFYDEQLEYIGLGLQYQF